MRKTDDKICTSIGRLLNNQKKRAAKAYPMKAGERAVIVWLLAVLIIRILVNTAFVFTHFHSPEVFYPLIILQILYVFFILFVLVLLLPLVDAYGSGAFLPSWWGPYPVWKRLFLAAGISSYIHLSPLRSVHFSAFISTFFSTAAI